jgi:hypothetical protein
MTESELPPTVPKSSGVGVVIGAFVLLGAGGTVWWVSRSDDEAMPVPPAAAFSASAPPKVAHAPPPPPPPPPPRAVEGVGSVASAAAADQQGNKKTGGPKPKRGPCDNPCEGVTDSGFKSALTQRAMLARGCYDTALRANPELSGKLSIQLRVSDAGRACSVRIQQDSLGSASVNACIIKKFESATYPLPRGGCADAVIPMNFVGKP